MKKPVHAQTETKASKPVTGARRIVLIDDHALVRQGLAQLLASRSHLSVVASAETAAEGLEAVRKHQPDLVISDLSLAKGDGIELIKQIKSELPKTAVLVVSMHDETVYADRALRAGARGYIMKKEPSEKIFEAIERLLAGEIYVSEAIKRELLSAIGGNKKRPAQADAALECLSDRELQVFRLLGNGMPTREIAAQLSLSVKTIESYRENLKIKLHLANGPALVRRAVLWCRTQPTGS